MLNDKENLKIKFNKITNSPLKFEKSVENLKFSGELSRKNQNLVDLKGEIKGEILYLCDRCGDEFWLKIDEKIELILSDGIFSDETHEFIDLIECFGGEIDMDEILQSEVEAYKSDYFYCDKCNNL